MEAPTSTSNTQDLEAAAETTQGSRTHVTALPKGFITVRIMQLLGAIIVLGLAAADFAAGHDDVESLIGMITAIVMTIIYGWIMITYWVPSVYNYWAVLTFEILGFLIWIDGFIWLLANSFDDYYDDYDCNDTYDYDTQSYNYDCDTPSNYYGLNNAAIAAATFGAVEMLLSFVSLVVISVFIGRHRDAGGHNKPGSAAPITIATTADLARENEKLRKGQAELQEQVILLQQQQLGVQHQGASARGDHTISPA